MTKQDRAKMEKWEDMMMEKKKSRTGGESGKWAKGWDGSQEEQRAAQEML